MSTTRHDPDGPNTPASSGRRSGPVRLAGAVTITVTVTAALTVGATTATAAPTAITASVTAFADPIPDPDPDPDSDSDSDREPELLPGPRVGLSSTSPREESDTDQEWVVEAQGTWRFRHVVGGPGEWRRSPDGQTVVTTDAFWVEVTGGPRSWCIDGETGQKRFPRTAKAVVRCG